MPKKRKPLHPIDKEILRSLLRSKIKVTPSQISRAIGIHPLTAQKRIDKLVKEELIKCKKEGNRTYCDPIKVQLLVKKLNFSYKTQRSFCK